MTIRNLDAVFHPKAVALVGASTRPGSVGLMIAHNLLAGGFDGPIMPVNPKHMAVAGLLCYPDVQSLPVTPDLAVICTPPATVPGLVGELGRRGTRGVIVITAGFRELGNAQGRALEQAMLAAARPHLMRIIGPNCVGVLSTPANLNASFAHVGARKGHVAFVAQSGAMVTTVLDWSTARNIGFSHLVSLGDMSDVDFGDMLDFLANDSETSAILLYIEAITQARKFMSAARAAARLKPVIAIKAGRHALAAKAAQSHTGALAGADGVYDAAFRRAGILRVLELDEVFDAVETLSAPLALKGDHLAILTNGGGVGVLATDALLDFGGELAELSRDTLAKLDMVLPPTWSHGNPVDIVGDAPGSRYADALSRLLEAPEVDAVLALNCPTAIASGIDAAQAVIDCVAKKRAAVLTSWLGAGAAVEARRSFSKARIPTYETPDKAIRGFMHLVHYRRGQEILLEVPSSVAADFTPDDKGARSMIRDALAAERSWLEEQEVNRLLTCYGIPVVRSAIIKTSDEAAACAREFGGKIALKIYSPDITHKSDVGGVVLDLEGAEIVREAAEAMLRRVAMKAPRARLQGFIVQEMVYRPMAQELILGMAVDAQFGPFILFGHGGTAVEVIDDKALALPPLNLSLARELMARTRVFRVLKGYRDHPPAKLDAIALALVQLSQLVSDLDEVVELDINPLLADEQGVIAVDARIRVAPLAGGTKHGSRFAILPYPKELEQHKTLPLIGDAVLRPVRPEDAPAFVTLFGKLTPEDIRMRFFASPKSTEPHQIARLTQIDYDREMAFVLYKATAQEIFGIARLAADPDNQRAEFMVLVRSDLKRRGLGKLLLQHLIAYARKRGIGELFGDIPEDNTAMIALSDKLGFTFTQPMQSPGIVRASLMLAPGK
jgi:acetyltransferase